MSQKTLTCSWHSVLASYTPDVANISIPLLGRTNCIEILVRLQVLGGCFRLPKELYYYSYQLLQLARINFR